MPEANSLFVARALSMTPLLKVGAASTFTEAINSKKQNLESRFVTFVKRI